MNVTEGTCDIYDGTEPAAKNYIIMETMMHFICLQSQLSNVKYPEYKQKPN